MVNAGLPNQDWDEAVLEMDGHFLQSRAWAIFLAAQDQPVYWDEGSGWSWVGSLHQGRGAKYLYLPYGPTIKQQPEAALDSLVSAGRELGVVFARLEPIGEINPLTLQGAAVKVKDLQPRATQIIDLTQSEEELRQALESGLRSAVNAAERRGLSFRSTREPGDIEVFISMLQATANKAGIKTHPASYFRLMAQTLMPLGVMRLFLAEHEGQPIASAIGFEFGPTCYYAHAASYPDLARKLRAAGPLVWFLLCQAKTDGRRWLDLYGITTSTDPQHPWAGFTSFKKSFGGQSIERLGTWEIPVKAWHHRLYRTGKRWLG